MPVGWLVTALGETCEILDSRRSPINSSERNRRIEGKPSSELFPYYGATGEAGKIDGYLFDGEHVLIGEDAAPFLEPHRGVSYLVSGKFWVNNHAHILKHPTSNRFLCHYLRQVNYRPFVTGTTRLKLNQEQLRKIPIPLPPLAEQRRIVARIEELFSELDAGEESLRRALRQLGVYRQSLLKQAFDGKLTAQWRKQNPEGCSAGWHKTTVAKIGRIETGTTPPTANPRNYGGELPFFKPTDLEQGQFVKTAREHLSESGKQCARVLPPGSVLVTCIGATIGKTGLAQVTCATNQQINSISPNQETLPEFAYYQVISPAFQDQIKTNASSTTLPILNKSKFSALSFARCSLPEQHEIVRLLDEQFTVIEQNEREIDAALKRSAALRQSILKKAFTGQLVPQDPTDEPASALLERIRAERSATQSATSRRTKAGK